MEGSTTVQGAEAGAEVLEAPGCAHQWLIDTPAGKYSKGTCRLCDEEKQFQNYIEGSSWGYDVSLEQLSGGSRLPTTQTTRDEKVLAEDA